MNLSETVARREEFYRKRSRTRDPNMELAKQFTVAAGSPVYIGTLRIIQRKEMLLSDEYETATRELKSHYPSLRLEKSPSKSLLRSPITRALALAKAGRYAEANRLAGKTLSRSGKNHGPTHPTVAISLYTLATVHMVQGWNDDAEPLLEKVLSIYEDSLGPDHANIETTMRALASVYDALGKWDNANTLRFKAGKMKERLAGRK